MLFGSALVAYGVIGIAIFAFVAQAIDRPLERVRDLSESVEAQREALIVSMERAEDTLQQMGGAVGNMDSSLADAKTATDRSSTIAGSIATSMFLLRDQMFITIPIVNTQPFVGLAPGFDQTGQQLTQLSTDLLTIGTSLNRNRGDIAATAQNMAELSTSVSALTETVRTGPGVEITEEALGDVRLAVYGIAGWMAMLAVGSVLVGLYLIFTGFRRPPVLVTADD